MSCFTTQKSLQSHNIGTSKPDDNRGVESLIPTYREVFKRSTTAVKKNIYVIIRYTYSSIQ